VTGRLLKVKSIKNFHTIVKDSPLVYSQGYVRKMQTILLSGVKVLINTIWGKITLIKNNK
jgi:hypothetical protein